MINNLGVFSKLWKAAYIDKLERIHLWHSFFSQVHLLLIPGDLFGLWRGVFAPTAPPCLRTQYRNAINYKEHLTGRNIINYSFLPWAGSQHVHRVWSTYYDDTSWCHNDFCSGWTQKQSSLQVYWVLSLNCLLTPGAGNSQPQFYSDSWQWQRSWLSFLVE